MASGSTRVASTSTSSGAASGEATWTIGRAFAALPIGLRPSPQADGQWEAYFGFFKIGVLDFTLATSAKHIVRRLSAVTSPKD